MTRRSRRVAGILLVVLPSVVMGGVTLLTSLIGSPEYTRNELRQDLWRAGHAHAGVRLVLSLIMLRYVDEAALPEALKQLVRLSVPAAAILMPLAFFFSMVSPTATEPNAMIHLAWAGAALVIVGVVTLGVGLLRSVRAD